MRVLLINGSIRGARGDTSRALEYARHSIQSAGHTAEDLVLSDYSSDIEDLREKLSSADAFVIGTGIYWQSWGSPLQRFLEIVTPWETGPEFAGKPAIAIASMDSVGGIDVCSRLLITMSLFGCCIPPLPIVVLSRTGQAAIGQGGFDDVWRPEDIAIAVGNMLSMAKLRLSFTTWPVKTTDSLSGSFPLNGSLDLKFPNTIADK